MKLKVNKKALTFETLVKELPQGTYVLNVSNIMDYHMPIIMNLKDQKNVKEVQE